MDVAPPGRGVGHDIGRGEAVEAGVDAFISKRHEKRPETELVSLLKNPSRPVPSILQGLKNPAIAVFWR